MQFTSLKLTGLALALGFSAATAQAADLTPVTVTTTWYAQAEHGGLYAAKAAGIYEKHGLDVTIDMGGPQVNNVQLLMGGKTDFSMGYALQSLNAVKEDIPLVTVAACSRRTRSRWWCMRASVTTVWKIWPARESVFRPPGAWPTGRG
ncbi:ABC transporter substrate-binding protein [Halopseudomonas pachastrellae]|nr:ABC transporter substrate-binding protein [Halopseudomonas pachastrellae]